MTHRLTKADYERLAVAIIDGATVDEAALLLGVNGRTIYRRAKADPAVAELIREAVADRDARRERVGCGTTTRYAAGCRCQPCRDAFAASVRLRRHARARQPVPEHVPHGSANTYRDWSCRCAPCTKANTEYNKPYVRAYWERRRAAS